MIFLETVVTTKEREFIDEIKKMAADSGIPEKEALEIFRIMIRTFKEINNGEDKK